MSMWINSNAHTVDIYILREICCYYEIFIVFAAIPFLINILKIILLLLFHG